jgi:hypothetical protein
MYKAYHSVDKKNYTLEEWIMNPAFINKDSKDRKFLVDPRCSVCKTVLSIRPKADGVRTRHFWHSTKNTDCPTVKENNVQYLGLGETQDDKDTINNFKIEVASNSYKIFLKCMSMCEDKLSIKEFIGMLECFTRYKIWNYRNLYLKYIPYMLLHLSCNIKKDLYFVLMPYKFSKPNSLWITSDDEKFLLRIDDNTGNEEKFKISDDFLKTPNHPTQQFNNELTNILYAIRIDKIKYDDVIREYNDINSIIRSIL